MTFNSDSLPNFLRLKSLKNVGGRRVMPGAQFLENLEDYNSDISGIASPLSTPSQPVNLPEPELGGELTSQSYDIRANSAQSPAQDEKTGFWSHVGRALADYIDPQKRSEMTEKNESLLSKARGMRVAPETPPNKTSSSICK